MRRLTLAIALLLLAAPLLAQSASPFDDITFTWDQTSQTGFRPTTKPEINRYDTLKIDVGTKFATDAGVALGRTTAGDSPLVTEMNEFAKLADALKAYTEAITAAVARNPGVEDVSQDPALDAPRKQLASVLREFITVVKPIDPALYQTVSNAFAAGRGYAPVATALQQAIDVLDGKLQASAASEGSLGMTATIVPPESDARALHLPGYDTNTEATVAAVPNYIPVVDDRTRAEVNAAQNLITAGKQLVQVPDEMQKSIADLQKTLADTREKLKTDVLDKNLAELETQIRAAGDANLGTLLQDVTTVRALVKNLNSADLTLSGSTDAERLLNLAGSMSSTAESLITALNNLPADLQKLSSDLDAAVKKQWISVKTDTTTLIKSEISTFMSQQTFFVNFAKNLQTLAAQFSANSTVALSAERLEQSARAIGTTAASLSTSLDLSRISGDVHVNDRIQISAALYRRDASGNLQSITDTHQSFIVQRYGFYPDSVRGGIIFADPRSKIDRDVSYQPAVALGYYWRYGSHGHPAWNSLSPSFGFTMSLLDFSDKNNLEIGFAAGVSLFRDLLWTGYGRNLQARAWYYYVGVNALALGKMIVNR